MMSRLLPILSFVLAIVIFFGYVSPTWSGSIAQTRAAIEHNERALAAASQYTEQQNHLASARDAIDPTGLMRLQTFLPDSVDNVGLILDLNALAARSGLSLSKVDVAPTAAPTSSTAGTAQGAASKGPVSSVDMTLSAVGSYSALQKFLQGVERSARLLDIRELSVKGSETGVYTYQMKLRLYWLR